uniref:Uncharacterized protein n=1 Tax=Romanomermis culicivorax TaxID=13658 RepID=A0A915HRC8_ROMCU
MKKVTRHMKQDRESSKEERKNNVKKNKKEKFGRIEKDKDEEVKATAKMKIVAAICDFSDLLLNVADNCSRRELSAAELFFGKFVDNEKTYAEAFSSSSTTPSSPA